MHLISDNGIELAQKLKTVNAGAPPGWIVWSTVTRWHARPPGEPDPRTYVHGRTRDNVIGQAWQRCQG